MTETSDTSAITTRKQSLVEAIATLVAGLLFWLEEALSPAVVQKLKLGALVGAVLAAGWFAVASLGASDTAKPAPPAALTLEDVQAAIRSELASYDEGVTRAINAAALEARSAHETVADLKGRVDVLSRASSKKPK